MGYAIGKAPAADGTGTTPEDFQRWLWSLYRTETASLARGGVVSGTSSMAYSVSPALLVLVSGNQQRVVVPTDAVTVPTAPAPSSGSRTEYIYAGVDGAVKVGPSVPENHAMMDKRLVPAGITATTATTSLLGNRKQAPLFGSSMGQIAAWKDPTADKGVITVARQRVAAMTVTLDSDRRIEAHLQVSYANDADANVDADAWKVPTYVWQVYVDGALMRSVELAVEAWPETKQARFGFDMALGTHTVELYRARNLTGGATRKTMHRVGGAEQWPGTTFTVTDLGGIE